MKKIKMKHQKENELQIKATNRNYNIVLCKNSLFLVGFSSSDRILLHNTFLNQSINMKCVNFTWKTSRKPENIPKYE